MQRKVCRLFRESRAERRGRLRVVYGTLLCMIIFLMLYVLDRVEIGLGAFYASPLMGFS
jgi:hypothetical protein